MYRTRHIQALATSLPGKFCQEIVYLNMMGTKQRDELIERIKNIKDPRVIEEIYRLLEVTVEEESVYVLTDEQKKEIAQAREEINRGEGIPAEDVDKEFDAWLNE